MNAIRQSLGILMGRRPLAMQVGMVCRSTESGDVLLITSRGTGRWVIPKGWPMEGKSLPGAAAVEAWEEAGVQGHVHPAEIGRYRYDKEQDRGYSIPVEVRVFLMDIAAMQADFPEAAERRRRWFPPAEAARMVVEPGLKQILLALPPQHG